MKKTKDYWHCDKCGGNFDHGEQCDCEPKKIKIKPFERLFLDGVEVLYLCDRKACKACYNPDCHHTNDISHSINFEKGPDGNYWEKRNVNLKFLLDDLAVIKNVEELYFWICPVCGANNSPLRTCQCGNKDYTVFDMFPIIKKQDEPKLKEYLNKIFGSGEVNES